MYENTKRLNEFNQADQKESTSLVDYFLAIQKKGMLPKTRGLIKSKDTERVTSLMLKSFFVRPDQATAIAEALKQSRFVSKMNFSNCGLTDETFLILLASFDKFVLKELDISHNPKLTAKSY